MNKTSHILKGPTVLPVSFIIVLQSAYTKMNGRGYGVDVRGVKREVLKKT